MIYFDADSPDEGIEPIAPFPDEIETPPPVSGTLDDPTLDSEEIAEDDEVDDESDTTLT